MQTVTRILGVLILLAGAGLLVYEVVRRLPLVGVALGLLVIGLVVVGLEVERED